MVPSLAASFNTDSHSTTSQNTVPRRTCACAFRARHSSTFLPSLLSDHICCPSSFSCAFALGITTTLQDLPRRLALPPSRALSPSRATKGEKLQWRVHTGEGGALQCALARERAAVQTREYDCHTFSAPRETGLCAHAKSED